MEIVSISDRDLLDLVNRSRKVHNDIKEELIIINEEIEDLEDIIKNPYELDIYKYQNQNLYDKIVSFDAKKALKESENQTKKIKSIEEIDINIDDIDK